MNRPKVRRLPHLEKSFRQPPAETSAGFLKTVRAVGKIAGFQRSENSRAFHSGEIPPEAVQKPGQFALGQRQRARGIFLHAAQDTRADVPRLPESK